MYESCSYTCLPKLPVGSTLPGRHPGREKMLVEMETHVTAVAFQPYRVLV